MMAGQSNDERSEAVDEAVFATIFDQIGKVHNGAPPPPKYICEFVEMIDVDQKMIDAYQKWSHGV